METHSRTVQICPTFIGVTSGHLYLDIDMLKWLLYQADKGTGQTTPLVIHVHPAELGVIT